MEYKLYNSNYIKSYQKSILIDCVQVFNLIKEKTNSSDSTWTYYLYNVFNISSTSINFYNIYKELNKYIRDFIKNDKPLWMQAWLNYHENDNVLSKSLGNKFHGHETPYHGYISIDPQDTITKFKNGIEIKNKPGQIYIGPGSNSEWDHFVELVSPSKSPRVTLAFNITDKENLLVKNFIPLL